MIPVSDPFDLIDLWMDYVTYGVYMTEIKHGERRYFDIMQLYNRRLSEVHTEKVPANMLVNCTLNEILEAVHEKRS